MSFKSIIKRMSSSNMSDGLQTSIVYINKYSICNEYSIYNEYMTYLVGLREKMYFFY